MPDIVENLQDYTPETLSAVAQDLLENAGVRIDGQALLRQVNNQSRETNEELNFSSELEIDDRFEKAEEKFDVADKDVIDRSMPAGLRKPVKAMRAENKRKVFDSY